MLAHPLLPLLVFEHGFIQIRFGIFEYFCFCFMSNKLFLILLNFTQYLFSVNTIFLMTKNIRNECSEAATRGVLQENVFHKIHGKTPVPETFLKKRLWPQACNFIKKEYFMKVFHVS